MFLTAKADPYVSGEVVMFDTLVRFGEEKSSTTLPFHLRGFLVQCLVEHQHDPDIVHHVLALDFLESRNLVGSQRAVFLKRAGDASLLLAGFFPERAIRLNVSSSYFRMMGQSLYGSLAVHFDASSLYEQGKFYNTIAENFSVLELVLRSTRGKAESEWELFRRFLSVLN